ncbi:hypothetical protein [Alicyclobacillus sp.]|uniref:hypothetical protein n=1 Tax=Alicyclobacillus sp. TaxID=61169 RepID=UPI0025C7009E|nr:hypothetical protein [Alicyclobacillus sp.]MCL6517787.1 hypothetical protein [Alicyclobacillus sp.]
MQGEDVWAILLGAAFLLLVARSLMSRSWQSTPVPLEGPHQAARRWLEDNGYIIVAVRPEAEWHAYHGAQHVQRTLFADFLVRQGARYFAVVLARNLTDGALESRLAADWYLITQAFGVEGLLHVDVENELVHEVDFELTHPPSYRWRQLLNRSLWFLGGVLFAFALFHAAP